MEYKIALIRHGETPLNVIQAFVGTTDDPLTATGIEQAKSITNYLKHHNYSFDTIFYSPLKRAAETARIIHNSLEFPQKVELKVEPLLRERDYGIFEGLTKPQFLERYPEHSQLMLDYEKNKPFVKLPGGETAYDVESRVKTLLFEQLPNHFPKGANLLFVAHLNPIRAVLHLLGLADWSIYFRSFRNTSLTVVKTDLKTSKILVDDFSCQE